MKMSVNKRCPRCNMKVAVTTRVCPNCQLDYTKFDTATNKEAKIALREGDGDNVLLRTGLPSDVSKWKLLLMAIFLGFVGGHYYYVGRTKMGIFFTAFFLVGVVNAVITSVMDSLPKGDWYQIFILLVMIWGVVIVLWVVDVAKIILGRFKVPVSRR